MDDNTKENVLWEMNGAHAAAWAAGQEVVYEKGLRNEESREARKAKKLLEKELEQTKTHLAGLTRQVAEMRAARAKGNSQPAVAAPDVQKLSEELRLARRQIEQLQQDFEKKAGELSRTGELLQSVLAGDMEGESRKAVKLSPAELREKRGVVIGGHGNLTSKLRKELTNCVFYSPDVKSLDEDAVRNAEYILLVTGYVNHCLTGHALRLSRLYGIPAGYTDRTNVNLVLEDVAAIFA